MTGTERTLHATDEEVEFVAYDSLDKPYRGYSVRASYLKKPNESDALIEIFKDGAFSRSFKYPAYRIYNIAAHFTDMVDREIERLENPSAHVAAGVTSHD